MEFLRNDRELIMRDPRLLVQFDKILTNEGRIAEAVRLLEEACEAKPLAPGVVARLVAHYVRIGVPAKAIELLEDASDAFRSHSDRWEHVRLTARAYVSMARPEHAAVTLRKASQALLPAPPDALIELAEYELAAGNANAADEARQAALSAIRSDPMQQPLLWLKFGSLQQRAGNLDAAEAAYRKAATFSSVEGDAERALVNLLFKMHRISELEMLLSKSASPPEHWRAEALGKALRLQRRLDEAAAVLHPLVCQPLPDRALIVEHGRLLSEMGQFAEALADFERAREMAGGADAVWEERHWHLLAVGALEEAWRLLLFRKRRQRFQLPKHASLWAPGEALDEAPVVIAEQGVGDEIKFATCYRDLLQDAPGAVITCDPRLQALFERSLPGTRFLPVQRFSHEDAAGQGFLERRRCISPGNGAPLDVAVAPLLDEAVWHELQARGQCVLAADLMGRYRTAKEAFAATRPPLRPAPELKRKWRERLAGLGSGPKIGLSWRGMGRNPERLPLYASLAQWMPVLRLPGAQFVNLQHGISEDELRLTADSASPLHRWSDFDVYADLEDLAALLSELDLVISAHSMTKELAGAVGARTWLVYYRCDPQLAWRRLADGTDLWFPSIRHVISDVPTTAEKAIAEVRRQLAAAMSHLPAQDRRAQR